MATFTHARVIQLSTLAAPTPATTTYSFTFTTASGLATPIPFTLPFIYPNYDVSPGRQECCSRGSQIPQNPDSRNASCAISNAMCDNTYPFWGLLACCNGGRPEEAGYDNYGVFTGCTAQCDAVGQSWQDLQECLEQRAKVVVCKPDDNEIVGDRIPSVWSTHAAAITTPITSVSSTSTHDCGYVETKTDKLSSTYIVLGNTPGCKEMPTSTATASLMSKQLTSGAELVSIRTPKFGAAFSVVVSLGSIAGMLL